VTCDDASVSPPTRQDEPVLALLPGALIEPSRDLLARLGWSRRVVPLGYADATSMSELTDALAARLAEAGVGRADVLGSSYGGWVAQCLAQRHPALVRDLVLVHTFALRAADARRFRLGLKLWKLMPRASFGLLGAARVKRLLRPLRAASPADYGRVEAQLVEAIRSPATIDALWRQNLCMLESCTAFAENLPRARRVLIVESDDDPAVGADDRARLRARFPGAAVRTFHGTGHITALVAPEAYAEAVNAFLDSRV
jgi:pimeloyl-ACP methyl ester carboxylesterase